MTVLIAGCGYVGTALGRLLAADGERVLGLRRTARPDDDGIETLVGDVTDSASLAELSALRSVDRVVYAVSPGGRTDEAYRTAYVDGVASLGTALDVAGANVGRFVIVTSTGVYGQSDGEWVDETSETRPGTPFGERLLEGERVAASGPWECVAVRLAGIYGPGRTRLIDTVRRGEAKRAPSPRYTNRIHRDDCAGAIRHVLSLETPAPVFVGVDHEPADLGDVYAWIASQLGLPEPPVGDEPPARRGTHKRCRNARLLDSGYVFRFPTFREGYASLLG